MIPPSSLLVERGKGGKPRVVPLNKTAHEVLEVLLQDVTTGIWLFTNDKGEPMKAIKKGFHAACVRAGLSDFRSKDLRRTFATRLVERGVHEYTISSLLGHTTQNSGFGAGSRITSGYAHATWGAKVKAVLSLEDFTPYLVRLS